MMYLLILRDTETNDEWVHPKHFDGKQEAEHIGRVFKKMDSKIVWRVKVINPINVAEGLKREA